MVQYITLFFVILNGKCLNFNQNENKDISCVTYLGKNSLYRLATSMELFVDIFGWDEISKFIENFFKKYKNSDIEHF